MDAPSEQISDILSEDKLVDLWGEYPCLYEVSSPDFKNRDKKDLAMQDIAKKVDQTVDWVKAKLRALRNSYTKAKKPQSSGSARKGTTKRTAWLLEKLQFLAPHIATRASVSNFNASSPTTPDDSFNDLHVEEDDDEDDDDTESAAVDDRENTNNIIDIKKSTKMPIRPAVSRKKQADEEYQLIKSLSESITQRSKRPKTENKINAVEVFGRHVIESLSDLDKRTRHIAEHKINDILFDAQMGRFNQQNMYAQQQPFPQQQYYHQEQVHAQVPPQNLTSNWAPYPTVFREDQLDASDDPPNLLQL